MKMNQMKSIIHGSREDKQVAMALFIAVGLFVVIVCAGVFKGINTIGTAKQDVEVRLVDREYLTGWVQPIVQVVGKTPTTQAIVHPEEWIVVVMTDGGGTLKCRCNKEIYDEFRPQRKAIATISSGRVTRETRCEGIQYQR